MKEILYRYLVPDGSIVECWAITVNAGRFHISQYDHYEWDEVIPLDNKSEFVVSVPQEILRKLVPVRSTVRILGSEPSDWSSNL